MLCWEQVDHVDFRDELLWFWVASGIVRYEKNFKRHSLTIRVLPDFRDKALIEPVQRNQKSDSWCLSFPSKLGVSSLIDKVSPDYKPDWVCIKQ